MAHIKTISKQLLLAGLCVFIGACSKDDSLVIEEESTETTGRKTVKMELVGGVMGFDNQSMKSGAQTKGTSSTWTNGDLIYITFYNGTTIVSGEATYNSSAGWSVSYDGTLATGTDLKCEARYFVNATFSSSSLVSLNSSTEIYEDVNAKYAYSNGSLTVQATLVPKTGRIRFTGTSGAKIYTTGISVYTTFAPAINTFSTSNAMITSTVGTNGSTPYIYGVFTDTDRNLGMVGADFAYTRTCTADMFKVGESGYMAIPSESSHNNWRSGLYVKARGVEFKMIPVAGLSSGFFLIGETEVTEALYKSVNGTASTSLLPISSIYYTDATAFIEKLNNQTKLHFAIPSAAQWKYAAKGGSKSQSYTYSGSNTPGDVAWYSANTSTKQNVKTKAPNELGIYDMSGNVGEFVTDNTGNSSGSAMHDIYGGCCFSTSGYITSTSYAYYNSNTLKNNGYTSYYGYSTDSGVGFRIILTCP